MTDIEKIIDRARWAPSGDNEQPCRVRVISNDTFDVFVENTLQSLFHLNHYGDHIALGMFIETAVIAANHLGFDAAVAEKGLSPSGTAIYQISIKPSSANAKDVLGDYIEQRSVNRYPYTRQAITAEQKQAIENQMPAGYAIQWFDKEKQKKFARLIFQAGAIRYRIPEMFLIHSTTVEWDKVYSEGRMPGLATGLPKFMLPISQWVMGAWWRADAYNRFMGGHWLLAFQLEYLPNFFCGSGIAIVAPKEPHTAGDWVNAGRAVARFWLSATKVDLKHQPSFTPLIFSKYIDQNKPLSVDATANRANERMRLAFSALVGGEQERRKIVWLGRLGNAKTRKSRSLRKPIAYYIKGA